MWQFFQNKQVILLLYITKLSQIKTSWFVLSPTAKRMSTRIYYVEVPPSGPQFISIKLSHTEMI